MNIRCFIAINLLPEVKSKLAHSIQQVRDFIGESEISYVNVDNIHMTLHFLDEIDEKIIPPTQAILEKAVASIKAFKLEATGFNAFPNLTRPRVLIVGLQEISPGQKLASLHSFIGHYLTTLQIAVETRPFVPHLTFARIKTKMRIEMPEIILPKIQFEVPGIEFMSSELTPSGARYKVISKHKFNG